MTGYEFRLESKRGGIAHVLGDGLGAAGYALCGIRATGITVTTGTPCEACLAAAAEREVA